MPPSLPCILWVALAIYYRRLKIWCLKIYASRGIFERCKPRLKIGEMAATGNHTCPQEKREDGGYCGGGRGMAPFRFQLLADLKGPL
jgi:hypothetical protein